MDKSYQQKVLDFVRMYYFPEITLKSMVSSHTKLAFLKKNKTVGDALVEQADYKAYNT